MSTAVNKMSRSTHGLDHRGDNWRAQATCADVGPIVWDALRAKVAAHICLTHCPVRQQCLNDAVATPPERRKEVVLGGVAFGVCGQPEAQIPADWCRRCYRQGGAP